MDNPETKNKRQETVSFQKDLFERLEKLRNKENLTTKELRIHLRGMPNTYTQIPITLTQISRAKKSQLIECHLIMRSKGGDKYFEPIFKGQILVFTFIFAWVSISLILIKLGLEPIFNTFFYQ